MHGHHMISNDRAAVKGVACQPSAASGVDRRAAGDLWCRLGLDHLGLCKPAMRSWNRSGAWQGASVVRPVLVWYGWIYAARGPPEQHSSEICWIRFNSLILIIKARQYLNRSVLMSLYHSFIYPYLTYCNHMWGATYKTRLKRLVMLQNKTVRILSHAGNRTSSDPLYKKNGYYESWKHQHVSHWSFNVLCVFPLSPTILQDFIQKKQWISLLHYQICPSFTYTFCEIRLK